MMLTLIPVGCGHLHTLGWPAPIHVDQEPEPQAAVRWFSDDYIGFQPYSRPYSQPYSIPYSTPHP